MAKNPVIFANTGTSILRNPARKGATELADRIEQHVKALKESDESLADIEAQLREGESRQLVDDVVQWALQEGSEASAEIKSTEMIIEAGGESVQALFFFATDTVDGLLAAHIVGQYFEASPHDIRFVEVERVGGLQVTDGAGFIQYGLPEYLETIFSHLKTYPGYAYRRIFNPTGGFKSLVPYMTVIAMLEEAETKYIYEWSNDLIDLRPLPIEFDEELVRRAMPILAQGAQGETFERQELVEAFDIDTPLYQSAVASLWSQIDDVYILSGMGRILFEKYKDDVRNKLRISGQARRDLERIGAANVRAISAGFRRLAHPEKREAGRRGKYRTEVTDCACLGQSQADYRIHYFEATDNGDRVIHIVRVFYTSSDHDLRDRALDEGGIFRDDFDGWRDFAIEDYI